MTTPATKDDASRPGEDEKAASGPSDPRETDHPAGEGHAEDNVENEPAG